MIENIPDYTGAGIYALIGSSGRVYIGSSKNVKKRMIQHKCHMNRCKRDGRDGFLNDYLEKAVLEGELFRCELLATFNCEMSQKELREIERVFISKFGGLQNTFNVSNIKHSI